MSAEEQARHPKGKHRYRSVVEGMELANEFARSGQSITEFARQRGVSFNMVKYWSMRARQLASASSSDLVQVGEVSASGILEAVSPAAAASAEPVVAPVPPVAAVPRLLSRVVTASPPTIEVRLPNGMSIGIGAGFSPQMLAQVIACVGGQPC